MMYTQSFMVVKRDHGSKKSVKCHFSVMVKVAMVKELEARVNSKFD